MTDMNSWKIVARIDWVAVGIVAPLDWEAFPTLKASIVFADVARHELFSSSGTAASRIRALDGADSGRYVVEVLLPPDLIGYAIEGAQFLVVRGSVCIGVGVITGHGGPTSSI